jgi:protein-tyrosine-phosphatase
MPAILFVCTANVCRSPLAEALFKEKLAQEGLAGWQVESAGTWAMEGYPAAEKGVRLLGERGIDLRRHRARGVTRELLRQFDLILVMEKGHKEALRTEFPEIAERVLLVSELVGETREIGDPMGGSLDDFRETIRDLEDIFERGFAEILQRVPQR